MKLSTALWGLILGIGLMACDSGDNAGKFLKTPSGYEYQILNSTNGTAPNVGDYVFYHAYFYVNDSLFNSTRILGQEPSMPIQEPAPGARPNPLGDVLSLMAAGDSAWLRIPIDSLPQRPPEFQDSEFIDYYIATARVLTQEEFKAEQQARMEAEKALMDATIARAPEVVAATQATREAYVGGTLEGVETSESGLKYLITDPGAGKDAEPGRQVTVHYVGMLTDGTIFDQSFERGSPIPFQLGSGQVIRGWDEGIDLLKEGGKATFFIPSDLAYGEQGRPGSIPGGAELIFYVELEEVK